MARNTRVVAIKAHKKAKQVTSNTMKIKKLSELKKVQTKIDTFHKQNEKQFRKQEPMFDKARKLREQLGID